MCSHRPSGHQCQAHRLAVAVLACLVALSCVAASDLQAASCHAGARAGEAGSEACTEEQVELAEAEALEQLRVELLQRDIVPRKVKQQVLATADIASQARKHLAGDPRKTAASLANATSLAQAPTHTAAKAPEAPAAKSAKMVTKVVGASLVADSAGELEDPSEADPELSTEAATGVASDSPAESVQPAIAAEHIADAQAASRDVEVSVAAGPASAAARGEGAPPSDDVFKPQVWDHGSGEDTTKAPNHRIASATQNHHSDKSKELAQAVIPLGALALGVILWASGLRSVGMLTIFFGAQTGFSLYMKVMLSNALVSQELQLKGVPAGFLVTALQQAVAFLVMCLVIMVLWPTRWQYRPRRLTTWQEWATILTFSLAFATNIGLNNFSLSLLAMSLNLIIRSCVPLVTLVVQFLVGSCQSQAKKTSVTIVEVVLMVAGVAFAGLATMAKEESAAGSAESKHLVLGVFWCLLSDFACALNLVLGGMFATNLDPPLNPIDTIFYMALPAALFLLPVIFKMAHPIDWPGYDQVTDWEVFVKVAQSSPQTVSLLVLSGVISAAYNVLQYTVVQSLSPTHAAFAGNFNKAATILLSMVLGLETVPNSIWGLIMVLAIVGNVASFTGYSLVKIGDKGGHGHAGHGASKDKDDAKYVQDLPGAAASVTGKVV